MKKQNTIKCAGKQQVFLLGLVFLASSAVAVPAFANNSSVRSLSNTEATQAQAFNHTVYKKRKQPTTPMRKRTIVPTIGL